VAQNGAYGFEIARSLNGIVAHSGASRSPPLPFGQGNRI